MNDRAPKRIYLEVWPEEADRSTTVHLSQTGYGVDLASGESSRIFVYERVPQRRLADERRKKAKTK